MVVLKSNVADASLHSSAADLAEVGRKLWRRTDCYFAGGHIALVVKYLGEFGQVGPVEPGCTCIRTSDCLRREAQDYLVGKPDPFCPAVIADAESCFFTLDEMDLNVPPHVRHWCLFVWGFGSKWRRLYEKPG